MTPHGLRALRTELGVPSLSCVIFARGACIAGPAHRRVSDAVADLGHVRSEHSPNAATGGADSPGPRRRARATTSGRRSTTIDRTPSDAGARPVVGGPAVTGLTIVWILERFTLGAGLERPRGVHTRARVRAPEREAALRSTERLVIERDVAVDTNAARGDRAYPCELSARVRRPSPSCARGRRPSR